MQFPFVHFAQGADHGQVHHGTGFDVDGFITPAKAPGPFGHGLLEWLRELVGVVQGAVDVFIAQRGLAFGDTAVEKFFVHG